MNIQTKLANVKKEIGVISKDSKNPFFKSKYFDINALLRHVEPLLQENGLLLIQPIVKNKVCSIILDIEGDDEIVSSIPLPNIEDPQKLGSAITYFRRYTLQSLLALQAEDDDGNVASGNNTAPAQNKKWVNKGDKVWEAALEKKLPLSKLKEFYSISKANQTAYENELKGI